MIKDAGEWATAIFKESELGDPRRTKRLIKLATCYAKNIGSSTVECCEGDEGQVEAAYRFLRNESVNPAAIRAGGFQSTVHLAAEENTLLAIEDTMTLSYHHGELKNSVIPAIARWQKRRGLMFTVCCYCQKVPEGRSV
jgi:hypothetical protein